MADGKRGAEQIRDWVLAAVVAGKVPRPGGILAMSQALSRADSSPIGPYETTLWAVMRRLAEVWPPGTAAFEEAAKTLNAAEVMFKTSGDLCVTQIGFCAYYRPVQGRRILLAGAFPSGPGSRALDGQWPVSELIEEAGQLRAAWRVVEQRVGLEWWDDNAR